MSGEVFFVMKKPDRPRGRLFAPVQRKRPMARRVTQ